MCNRFPNPGVCLSLVLMTFLMYSLGDRVETSDAVVEGLVELDVPLLRTLHVHADLSMPCTLWVHKREVNCLSSLVMLDPSFF